MEVKFYEIDEISNSLLKYAVIVTNYKQKWVLVKHQNRESWEIPGGKREENEEILLTAKRELIEETGAMDFEISAVCIYGVIRDEMISYGLLCHANVASFTKELEHEISERDLFDSLPEVLTYPAIQPFLHDEIIKRLYVKC